MNRISRSNDQRAYLIGKRYKEEKKAIGANRASIKEQVKQINKHVIPHNEEVKDYKSTSAKIAEQSKVSHATVERAEKFADAVDKVAVGFERLKQLTPSDTIAAIKQSLPNLDKNGGNSYHESGRNLDKANITPKRPTQKIAEQTKVHFNTSEKFFDNEHDVINWIIDNQLSRRNITDDQRAYLIGKRYKEEKKAVGELIRTDKSTR
jgi:hypothetical protein